MISLLILKIISKMEQNLNSLNTSDCVNRRNTVSSYNVKEMMNKKERLAPGHRMCAGCGATIGVRAVLRAYMKKIML